MSQPPNSVLNGPSENIVPFKDAQPPQMMIKTDPNINGSSQPYPGFVNQQRPPLTRIDSRSSLGLRPGFPTQPGAVFRPPQLRQPLPGQPFVQRVPSGQPRPPQPGQPQYILNQGVRSPANFRPPFPRPLPPQGQPQRQPGIFQQRSAPAFGQQRPPFESEQLLRSYTLDSTDLLSKTPENVKNENDDTEKTTLDSLKDKAFTDAYISNEAERRRSVSSTGSVEDKKSILGSSENLDKKSDEYPSRPESRASSRMNKIVEDEIKEIPRQTDVSQKIVDFSLPKDDRVKSPEVRKIKDQNEAQLTPEKKIGSEVQQLDSKKLDLKISKKPKSPSRSEGDNDSGVDESTQGNDQSSNGDHNSPRKSSGKSTSRTSSTTPTNNRSKSSKSPSLKSPDSTASTPGTTEKKKIPMNKVQVGSAPSPNLKVVRSKIGSLDNATYKPGGGHVKIESKKLEFKNTSSRIAAKNDAYAPKGGDKKIPQQKLQWNAKSKIGSLENTTHKPKGGEKKIESVKLDFKENAKSKVGSKDNIKHVAGGGEIKIKTKKIEVHAQSKIGSLDNVKHKPGGGDKKVFDDKEYLKQMSAISSENHSLSGSQIRISSANEGKYRILETVCEEILVRNRPKSSPLSRSSSLRIKKSTPRPPWRF